MLLRIDTMTVMRCADYGGDGEKELPREASSPSNLGQMALYFATPVSKNWGKNTPH